MDASFQRLGEHMVHIDLTDKPSTSGQSSKDAPESEATYSEVKKDKTKKRNKGMPIILQFYCIISGLYYLA